MISSTTPIMSIIEALFSLASKIHFVDIRNAKGQSIFQAAVGSLNRLYHPVGLLYQADFTNTDESVNHYKDTAVYPFEHFRASYRLLLVAS